MSHTPQPIYAQLIWRYSPPLLWALALYGAYELTPLCAGLMSLPPRDPTAHLLAQALTLTCAAALLWLTNAQNAPAGRLEIAPPTARALLAALLLALGGVILGSELDNMLKASSDLPPPPPLTPELVAEREGWRGALSSPLGLTVTGLLMPITEAWVFLSVFQRNLAGGAAGHREGGRVLLTALALTLCSWRLSPNALIANAAAAWLLERTRSPAAGALGLVVWQGVGLWVSVGGGLGVEGFDDLSAPWQPLWFDLLGCVCLVAGWRIGEGAAVRLDDGEGAP